MHHLDWLQESLQLDARSERDINWLNHTTMIHSNNTSMSFILDNFGWLVTRKGKVVRTEGIVLPESYIADAEDSYKYLEILQTKGNQEETARKAATAKHLQSKEGTEKSAEREEQVLGYYTYALPVIEYFAGLISWPKEEMW